MQQVRATLDHHDHLNPRPFESMKRQPYVPTTMQFFALYDIAPNIHTPILDSTITLTKVAVDLGSVIEKDVASAAMSQLGRT